MFWEWGHAWEHFPAIKCVWKMSLKRKKSFVEETFTTSLDRKLNCETSSTILKVLSLTSESAIWCRCRSAVTPMTIFTRLFTSLFHLLHWWTFYLPKLFTQVLKPLLAIVRCDVIRLNWFTQTSETTDYSDSFAAIHEYFRVFVSLRSFFFCCRESLNGKKSLKPKAKTRRGKISKSLS